jgi:hypothetical protein
LLLGARRGLGADPLLEIGGALGRAASPLAQPLDLARLGERQQREHRYSEESDKCRDGSDLRERARQ